MALRTRVLAVAATLAAVAVPAVAHATPTEEDWAVGVQVGVHATPLSKDLSMAYGGHVRRVILPRVSVGVSFAHLDTGSHYEHCKGDDCPKSVEALRAFGELHLLPASWFDPWVRLGVGADVRRGSNWYDATKPSETRAKFGVDALLGLDLHVPHVSVGPDVRYGVLGFGVGLHAEARF